MAIKTVKFERQGSNAIVVVESSLPDFSAAIEEGRSMDARRAALEEAVKNGFAQPAINGIVQAPYAVDEEGNLVRDTVRQKIAAYRADIPVINRMF